MKDEIKSRKQPNRTLRFVFEYEGNNFKLISKESVEMIAPPSDLAIKGDRKGFWYELRNHEGEKLYKRFIPNPMKTAVEVRTDNPKKPLTWKEVEEPTGYFVILAPDMEEAQNLVMYHRPLKPKTEKKVKIASFDLKPKFKRVV